MIDEALLQKLAMLARIEVDPADIPKRLDDFRSILKCIDVICAVQIPEGFQPITASVNHVRADVVRDASPETVLGIVEGFPDNVLGQLRVPQVLKK